MSDAGLESTNDNPYSDHIKIMAITWNMAGLCPDTETLNEIFKKDDVLHDLYVFGSQEAVRSITKSMVNPSKV